jgi:hypothetical protein
VKTQVSGSSQDGTLVHGRGTFDINGQSGLAGVGGVFPAFKFNAGVTYGLKNFGAGVSTKFIGSFKECGDSGGDFAGGGLCYVDSTYSRKVPAYATFDLFLTYTIPSPLGRTNVGVGAQNVFDTKPAAIYNGFLAATDPTAYDVLGRFVYFRLSQTF